MFAIATMNPETIRRTAQEVLSNPRYQSTPTEGANLLSLLAGILERILDPFVEIFELLNGVSRFLAWTVFGFVVITLVVLLVVGVHRLIHSKRVAHVAHSLPNEQRHRDPLQLEKLAGDSLLDRDYVVAVRLYLMATLLRLELAQEKRFRPGMTNREHLRRYRRSPIFKPMQYIVDRMDQTWYGGASCDLETASKCRDAYQEIRSHIQRRAHVNRT